MRPRPADIPSSCPASHISEVRKNAFSGEKGVDI
jgi:hypothetical protein